MIVLDASALVDAALRRPVAPWVLDQIAAGPVCAPAHQPAEAVSALARLRRAGTIDPATTDTTLGLIGSLEQEIVAPDVDALRAALALDGPLRVTDALYVVLAQRRGCALVTTDARLARSAAPCEIRFPG